ncbi:hypothetical protein ABW19_dt0200969 [Dactylella cylindrospora]|nr:hypothetical protein ABW19_dt0200969 [Dactylella cylindrospora]
MAQKAAKATAKKNNSTLTYLHLISLAVNAFFLVVRFGIKFSSITKRSIWLYAILNTPSIVVELYMERIGRPGASGKAGEDLGAGGLMEFFWDIIYINWACLVLVAIFGEWVWYLWITIPLSGAFAAFSTFNDVRDSLGGMGGGAKDMAAGPSKRQTKMEKRNAEGKNVKYK